MNTQQHIALSLVAHTNVGKTTLARTLLRRDIGVVRDEAHVTLVAESHRLVDTPEGDVLELWDTPGFGDSVRLAKRLAQAGNPLGWFLGQVWDRFRDRGFWASQRAARHVLDASDVVLYLVNAAEQPQDASYLEAELRVLALIGKPVVVLLNQVGPPQPADLAARDLQLWRDALAAPRGEPALKLHGVLPLDAFARCWVQEGALLDAVATALPVERRSAFARLQAAWTARGQATWLASMAVLAEQLAQCALDSEALPASDWGQRARAVGRALGLRRVGDGSRRGRAMRALTERLQARGREAMDRLIALQGLEGRAAGVVLDRLAEHYRVQAPVDEGRAALLGGALSGALTGLKADVVSGGLTLGGGMIAGGLIGALGAAGLARGFNLLRGVETPRLTWSQSALEHIARTTLLGYLAVAHYGRGRGEWADAEHPPYWADTVDSVVAAHREALGAVWAQRPDDAPSWAAQDARRAATHADLVAGLRDWFDTAGRDLLLRLYPAAGDVLTRPIDPASR